MQWIVRISILIVSCIIFNDALSQIQSGDQENKLTEIKLFRITDRPGEEPTPYYKAISFLKVQLDSAFKKRGYSFTIENTTGSFHTAISIDELQSNDNVHGIGLVQSDVLYHYLSGNHPQVPISKKNADLRAIAKLFPEWLHVSAKKNHLDNLLYRSENKEQILSLFDHIVVNDIGSGSFVTTLNVGRIMNLKWTNLSTIPLDDNFFSFTVQTPTNKHDSSLIQVGLDKPSAQLLSTAFEGVYDFVDTDQLSEKYNNDLIKNSNRATIAVNAILVSSKALPNEIVSELHEIITGLWYKEDNYLLDSNGRFLVDETFFRDSIIYESVDAHFTEMPINRHYWIEESKIDEVSKFFITLLSSKVIFWLTIVAALYLIFRTYLIGYWKAIRSNNIATETKFRFVFKSLRKLFLILFLILLYHFVISVFIYVSEHHFARHHVMNNAISRDGIWGSMDWVFRHLTIGNTQTLNSNFALVWIGVLQFSYALATSVAAYIAGDKVIKYIKHRRMNNHIILIGWSTIGKKVVEELEEMSELYQKEILELAIIGSQDYESTNVEEKFRNNYLKKHNLSKDLDAVNLDKSKAVIILSDKDWATDQNNTDLDLWTINRIHDIEKYLKKKDKKSKPRIIVEIQNENNIQLAKNNGADEVICIQNFGLELLAQAATRPNISVIFDQLLRSSEVTNEIYYRDIPDFEEIDHNITYSKLIRFLISKDQLLKQTPIGIYRSGDNTSPKIELNPDDDFKVWKNDQIIILAKEQCW